MGLCIIPFFPDDKTAHAYRGCPNKGLQIRVNNDSPSRLEIMTIVPLRSFRIVADDQDGTLDENRMKVVNKKIVCGVYRVLLT
ncbi:hypothetical protein NPIL_120131 [Nephila pilipes]|uniref:Uncharacterized protein n=1 Tax=Nephila pilipes TaxID=299642 RepID=A0A8X6IWC8_NEPPI|nr:hypothetical protein NPIL_120131 [Nephila pilipes]